MTTENASNEIESPSVGAPVDKQLTGYELVADMMRRQDEVIAELDALNERIESAIKEISEARQTDQAAAGEEEARDSSVQPQRQAA